MTVFVNPSLQAIRDLLQQAHHVAVIGLSPRPERPSHRVARALQGFGYHVIPVRPATDEVLGEPAYASLDQVPDPVDVADVFRAPEHVPAIVDQCIDRGVGVLWLQEGVVNTEAAQRAQRHGMTVVMDRCMLKDYRRLIDSG